MKQLPRLLLDHVGIRVCFHWHLNWVCLVRLFAGWVSITVGVRIGSSSVDKTTSYFGIMAFDLKLIPLFDGSDSGQSIVECFEKQSWYVDWVGGSISNVSSWCVCQAAHMPCTSNWEVHKYRVHKDNTIHSLALDPFATLKQFTVRRLQPGETVNVFLAEPHSLAVLFGGMSDHCLQCAFIAGLPEHAEELLQASSRMEDLDLSHVLAWARTILKNCTGVTEQASMATQSAQCTSKETDAPLRCYKCDGPNHRAIDCLLGCETFRRAGVKPWRTVMCYQCQQCGHIAQYCPGNKQGGENSAPSSSPKIL